MVQLLTQVSSICFLHTFITFRDNLFSFVRLTQSPALWYTHQFIAWIFNHILVFHKSERRFWDLKCGMKLRVPGIQFVRNWIKFVSFPSLWGWIQWRDWKTFSALTRYHYASPRINWNVIPWLYQGEDLIFPGFFYILGHFVLL
jgi:hypothetical protein